MNKIIHGDSLIELKTLPENSVDSIVTDPPYELGFMGKSWDSTGIANNVEMWKECLRVLKPGGYLLAFSGTRTYHRMASAIEDAGFEVRDQIAWCYGQGFPKSLNISLQIKKKYNIGLCTCNVFEPMIQLEHENSNNKRDNISNGNNDGLGVGEQIQHKRTDSNEMAKQIKNTNISPDSAIRKENRMCELPKEDMEKKQGLEKVGEPILQSGMCKSVSENEGHRHTEIRTGVEENQARGEREGQVLSDMQNKTTDGIASSSPDTIQNGWKEHNGELSGSLSELSQQDRENNRKRIEQIKNDCNTEEWNNLSRFICSKCYCLKKDIGGTALKPSIEPICMARKPLSEKTVAENCLKWGTGGINIDESRVETTDKLQVLHGSFTFSGGLGADTKGKKIEFIDGGLGRFPANLIHDNSEEVRECFPNESERFFKSIIYQAKASKSERNRGCEELPIKSAGVLQGRADGSLGGEQVTAHNNHPTVKPIALMEYLIKMVTPKNGTVLDPFAGSGSTLVAAKQNGYQYIGIEMTEEYIPIIEARLNAVI